ncbi:MAG: enoyl-CoA hydratase/isomerase family protein [Bacillota bacterium]
MAGSGASVSAERIGRTLVLTMQTQKLTISAMERLADELTAAASGSELAAVVLTGRGDTFCRGGELGDYTTGSTLDVMRFGQAFIALHRAITGIDLPVIAAVNGAAFGGGLNLVEASDLAIAARSARFSVPEVRAGLAPMMALVGVRRLMGRKSSMWMALTGDELNAQTAYEIGLVNQVVDDAEVLASALDVARRLVSSNPVAIRLVKAAYRAMDEGQYERQLLQGLHHLVVLLGSPEAKEAYRARVEGRPFRGRPARDSSAVS